MSEEKKILWLLDAYALIYRAHFAFSQNQMINSKGLNTSAIYGFTTTLFEVLSNHKPTHIAVVFDTSAPTERHIEFPAYKANREETPDDIRKAIPYIKRLIEGFNIPVIYSDGYEADDIIGTLAKKAEKAGYQTYMMTPDKDFGQLVSENIFMYKPARMGNRAEIWGIKEVCERFEISDPLQVIDYLGMTGDAVDNIPGLPGVGDKTAKKFLKAYGSLEGLLANTADLKGKMKEKVEANRELGLLSKKLATIIIDAPVDFDPKSLRKDPLDKQKLEELFAELEFRTLSKRILGEEVSIAPNPSGQIDLFSSATNDTNPEPDAEEEVVLQEMKTIESVKHNYHLVDTAQKRKDLVETLKKANSICFDTETTGLDPLSAELVGIAFSIKKGEAYYVPISENQDEAKKEIQEFKSLFEDESKELIAQNLKYDLAILKKYDIELKGKFFDTMIAHYLLEPDMKHNMDVLSENYLGYRPVSIETLIGKKGKNQGNMRDIAPAEVVEYAGEDADITFQLKEIFEKELVKNEVRKLFDEIEMPLISVLADMELEGINLDTKALAKFSIELGTDIEKLEKKIIELAGTSFNVDSPKQLGDILFNVLKIDEKAKKTKTGQFSTSEDTLSKLADKHEIIPLVLDYRSLKKLKSTYVDSLPELVNPETKRIHTSYMQTVAATGRLSSNNPNLQNIPIRTEKGREIRKAFIPRNENYVLLAADYSQIELRIIAALSKDESMIQSFKNGDDIHAATASKVFEVPLAEVDREMRSKAKMVNFGIIYGISAFGLSQRLGIKRTEAKEIIDSYFEKYPSIKAYMDNSIAFAKEHNYVETIMKRRRYLKDINGRNAIMRGFAERNAINAPIQGSAADIIKIAMINIQKEFRAKKFQSKLLLQVHDELVFDAHKDELEEIKKIIKEKMEHAVDLSVPLTVEMDSAENWLGAH
ncbi:MAG: DNA polymerase I [Bacteroidetes bacterium]|nr:MAG: DNA polymerase I [Bacteroidota bacterium]MBL1144889.1 DNA polymerase I [Bacteroidota bacterium]NOG57683.1 DNA polymerase I [Bacteroidota bacterium]